MRLDLLSLQLQGHVGIGHLVAIRDGIVQVAFDDEVVALAQPFDVERLVEAQADVVAVGVVSYSFRVGRTEYLRTTQILRHLYDGGLEGHLALTVHAKGLCAQLVDTVFGESHCRRELCTLRQLRGTFRNRSALLLHAPLLGQRPAVESLAAVLHTYTLQTLILAVEVGQRNPEAAVLLVVILVQRRAVDGHVDRCGGGYEVCRQANGRTYRGGVLGRLQDELDVLIVIDGAVALRYHHHLVHQLVGLHLDGAP